MLVKSFNAFHAAGIVAEQNLLQETFCWALGMVRWDLGCFQMMGVAKNDMSILNFFLRECKCWGLVGFRVLGLPQ
jgi:hypothetical protein